MTASELSRLIQGQWDARPLPEPLPHGVDLKRALVPPRKVIVIDRTVVRGQVQDEEVDAWLVLHEKPEDPRSYRIIYSEKRSCFGLATPGFPTDGHLVVCGWYGDFPNTLESM
jgi:hypothetical protein